MRIDVDDLTSSETIAFLEDHVTQLRALTPPESTHALDLEGLRAPGVVVLVGVATVSEWSAARR